MSDNFNTYIDKKFIGFSIILALIFWAAFTWFLLPFVPAQTPALTYFFSGFTAACLTGVFFLATFMFRLVKAEHAQAKLNRE